MMISKYKYSHGKKDIYQISVYHTLLETYNIIRNSSTEQIKCKWTTSSENKYSLRSITNNDLRVPEKPMKKCQSRVYLRCSEVIQHAANSFKNSKPYNLQIYDQRLDMG